MRIRGGHIAFTEYNVPINCAGARVCPGDYVLGDIDGVLVFSADRVEQIMELMEKIIVIEDEIMAEIIKKEDPQKIKATLQKVKALKSKLV